MARKAHKELEQKFYPALSKTAKFERNKGVVSFCFHLQPPFTTTKQQQQQTLLSFPCLCIRGRCYQVTLNSPVSLASSSSPPPLFIYKFEINHYIYFFFFFSFVLRDKEDRPRRAINSRLSPSFSSESFSSLSSNLYVKKLPEARKLTYKLNTGSPKANLQIEHTYIYNTC